MKKKRFAALPDSFVLCRQKKLFAAGILRPYAKGSRSIKTFGADMAEIFAECEKIYEKARFSRLEISPQEMHIVKNFAVSAKKAKFSSGSGHKGS